MKTKAFGPSLMDRFSQPESPFPLWEHETWAAAQGYARVAGGDEAGRGPWAGPVFAAFVVLPAPDAVPGVADSKILSRSQRRELFEAIQQRAIAWGIGTADAAEIDRLNILQATRVAFGRAFSAITPAPDFILLDHLTLPGLGVPARSFPKGESISLSVAAASILAKEARDRFMEDLDREYPGYGFASHMGYGTPQHQQALARLGPCPIHRRSFKPIKRYLGLEPRNETLF
jgi:ribonuclease HII